MLFIRSSWVEKKFKKSSKKLKLRINERLAMFQANRSDPILDDHSLHGEYKGYRVLI